VSARLLRRYGRLNFIEFSLGESGLQEALFAELAGAGAGVRACGVPSYAGRGAAYKYWRTPGRRKMDQCRILCGLVGGLIGVLRGRSDSISENPYPNQILKVIKSKSSNYGQMESGRILRSGADNAFFLSVKDPFIFSLAKFPHFRRYTTLSRAIS
jgi:hypothetical protein